jgi:hypothetical protein
VVGVGQRFAGGIAGVPVVIGVKRPCPPIDILAYRLSAVYEGGGDHPDPHAVSLNGLPPGQPVFGQLVLGPGEEAEVSVLVTYPNGYDPAGRYQIVMDADTDNDGMPDPLSFTLIASTDEADPVSGVPVEPITPQALRLSAMPNPFLAGATIAFTLPAAEDAEVAVYDLSGRLVRALRQGRLPAGTQNIAWDGRDDDGRATAGGIYFVRLRAGAERTKTNSHHQRRSDMGGPFWRLSCWPPVACRNRSRRRGGRSASRKTPASGPRARAFRGVSPGPLWNSGATG